jgi:hypothetical protein
MAIGILSVAIYLGFTISKRSSEKSSLEEGIIQPAQVDTSGFGNREYFIPLETSRAQLRGSVLSWSSASFEMEVSNEIYSINVPAFVYLRCMPLTVTGPSGETVETSSVFLDFRNAKSKGELVERSIVQEKIPEGADLTLIVDVDSNQVMTADMFVGYGCELE